MSRGAGQPVRSRARPAPVLPAALTALVLLVVVPAAPAQLERFAGWDAMVDPAYRFDPDERRLLGFHVAVPTDARSAFDEVEAHLDDGDALAAARRLLDVLERHGSHGLQVAEGRDRWESRWVGAGEWALYQLLTRIGPEVRARVLTPEQLALVERAVDWRDQAALTALGLRFEGLPASARALRTLALLLAEEGRSGAAQVAARRLDDGGRLAGALPAASSRAAEAAHLPAGESLSVTWPPPGSSLRLPIETLSRRDGRRRNPFTGPSESREAPFAPIDPLVRDGVLYLSDSISVRAHEVLTGRTLWHHAGPLERIDEELLWTTDFPIGVYISHDRPRAVSPYQVARPALGGGLVVTALQAAEPAYELDTFDRFPINHPLPRRRLVALDQHGGEVRWRQERPALGPRAFQNQFDAHGPPVVDGGLVYVAGSVTEGAINAYVAAFDLDDGELLWRTPLCSGQQELTMFNRPFQEHLVSPVLLHDGALYVSTNLGVVGCVDAFSGRLRWLAAYESIERRSSRMVRPMNARPIHWLNRPPFVVDQTLVVAPLDSEWLQGLDLSTGRRRFELNTATGHTLRAPLRHQALPAAPGTFVVVHDGGLECFDAEGRQVWISPPFGPYVVPTGASERAGDLLLTPADNELLVHDLTSGAPRPTRLLPGVPRRGRTIQRVQPAGPALLMVDGAELSAAVDLAEARRRAAADPGPRSDLVLGELALLERRYDEALARYEAAAEAADEPGLSSRAASGRTLAVLAQAQLLDTPEAWSRVLEVAADDVGRSRHAEPVLAALARLGAERTLVDWLARLAAEAPDLVLDLDQDGPQPVALIHARRRLPLLPPAEQVLLLQELVEQDPPTRWEGLAVAETARRRIDGLLASHGRELYAPIEERARRAAADGLDREALAARFPNAAVVAELRRTHFEGLLEAGLADRVLADCDLPELRLAAARQLGEHAYAERLEGRSGPPTVALPRLPADLGQVLRLTLSERHSIQLPEVSGRPDPALGGVALGCVQGEGALFLVDTADGSLRWSGRALPGGRTSVSHSVDFHMQDDVLVARGRDVLEGLSLIDGSLRWSHVSQGDVHEFVPVGGLVVTLEQFGPRLEIVAHGVVSGTEVFRIDLGPLEDARLRRVGDQLLCLTTEERERSSGDQRKQLLVIDLAAGALASATDVDEGDAYLNSVDEPPVVVLSRRVDGDSLLSAYDARDGRALWRQAVPTRPSIKQFVPAGEGRFLLRQQTVLPGRSTRRMDWDLLQAFDALSGPLPPPPGTPILRVVDPTSGPTPWLVLIDPDDLRRHVLLSGPDLAVRQELSFDEPLSSATEVRQAEDGVVLVPDPDADDRLTVRVLRGQDPVGRYSVTLDVGGSRLGPRVQLVDGAVVLGIDGELIILRSAP